MRAWQALRRAVAVIALLVRGLRTAKRFDDFDPARRHREIAAWSAQVLACMGIARHVHGSPHPGAALVIANHVSWLDIAAIHASCPQVRFVSKADVLRWPIVGPLIRASGTLFIERERKRDALRVVHEVAAALARGETVAVFPEGTTGPGDSVLPFHANLLQAAISAGAVVQPILLRYTEPQRAVSRAAQYIGSTTLVGSLLRLALARGVAVHVQFLAPIVVDTVDRRQLAAQVRDDIAAALADALAAAAQGCAADATVAGASAGPASGASRSV